MLEPQSEKLNLALLSSAIIVVFKDLICIKDKFIVPVLLWF